MNVKKALILAAGNGSRLHFPLHRVPKPLLSLAGVPLLRRVICGARQAGIQHFLIVVGKEGRTVRDYFAQHPVPDVALQWIQNDEYEKANGVSALKARHRAREPFLLLMTDHIFQPETARALLGQTLLVGEVILGIDRKIQKIFDLEDATKVRISQDRITNIGKELSEYDAVDTGMFLCSPGLFDALEASLTDDGNCSLSDGMRYLAERGRLRAFDIQDALWCDVDTPEAARHAEKCLANGFHSIAGVAPNGPRSNGHVKPIAWRRAAYLALRNRTLRRPRYVNIEVTLRCNARCSFCDYWKTGPMEVLGDYSPIINKIDPMGVTLSGGEPLVRKDLVQVVRKLHDNCRLLFLSINTHGGLLTIEKARELRNNGLTNITFSIDFPDERHEQSRGIKGLWKHLNEVVPRMPKLGYTGVQIHTIISKKNYREMPAFVELARRWGVRCSFTTFSYTKVGERDFWIQPEELPELERNIEEVIRLKRHYSHITNSDYYLRQVPEYFRKKRLEGCQAGKAWVHLSADGYIKTCSELPAVCHWTQYKPGIAWQTECQNCWFKCRGEQQAPITLGRGYEYAELFVRHVRSHSVAGSSQE